MVDNYLIFYLFMAQMQRKNISKTILGTDTIPKISKVLWQ